MPDTRPRAVIVDIDGTVALRGARNPYDESRAGEDIPNTPVVACVRALQAHGMRVVFVTGRRERVRLQTSIWLRANVVVDFSLRMRGDCDQRPDAVVKHFMAHEIFREFDPVLVLDDRNSVVAMWRSLGLTCLQVADGDF